MNQLYGLLKKAYPVLVFATPYTLKYTVFLHFSVGFLIEQMFDKIRSGLLEQNKLEHMFVFYLMVSSYRFDISLYYVIEFIHNNNLYHIVILVNIHNNSHYNHTKIIQK